MPVIISQVHNDGNEHGEGLVLVGLQNVEEIVIFKEAHGSVGNLQVDTANTSYNSLKELSNQGFNLIYFTNFENFLELSQEQCFLDTVGEWPVFQESFQQRDSQSSVLGEEEHGTSQQLLVELRASLDFVERNDDILEEDHVFVSQRNCESTDDTGQDIEEFSSTVELVSFVDQRVETLVYGLSNHLSSGYEL